eukprot:9133734-Pyramimonas_sp.AAC.1
MAAAPHVGAPVARFAAPHGVPPGALVAWSTWRRRPILARPTRNRGLTWYPQLRMVGYFARLILVQVLICLCEAPWATARGSRSFLTCVAARFSARRS